MHNITKTIFSSSIAEKIKKMHIIISRAHIKTMDDPARGGMGNVVELFLS